MIYLILLGGIALSKFIRPSRAALYTVAAILGHLYPAQTAVTILVIVIPVSLFYLFRKRKKDDRSS